MEVNVNGCANTWEQLRSPCGLGQPLASTWHHYTYSMISIYCIVDVREPASGISSKERFSKEWGALWEWLGGEERQWTEGGQKSNHQGLRQTPSLFLGHNDYSSKNKGRLVRVSGLLVLTCWIGSRRWDGWWRTSHITFLTNHCYRLEVSSPCLVNINDRSFLSLQLRKIRQRATILGS